MACPVVLIWPDAGQSDDEVREQLADLTADVHIAHWTPDADDGGRTDLLTSVRDARDLIAAGGGNPDDLTLIGLGLGGVAAAGLTHFAKRLGIGFGHVIAVAARWDEPDPFSGIPLEEVPERIELVDRADDVSAAITSRRRR